jgi:hypothetical protein
MHETVGIFTYRAGSIKEMRFSLHVPLPTPLRLSTLAGCQVSLPSRLREGLATGGLLTKQRIGRNVYYINQRLVALFVDGAA